MGDEVKVFDFAGHSVRVTKVDDLGVPWFIARDVCDVLGITWSGSTLQALEPEDKGCHTMTTLGGNQRMTTVSEAGLYQLVFKSTKEEAKAFKRWVVSEVLPSIRKTGSYSRGPNASVGGASMSDLQLLAQSIKHLGQVVDEVETSRRIAEDALAKANVNERQLADLSGEVALMVQRRQAALDSIPKLPPARDDVAPRTARSNIVELLRWAAITTEKTPQQVTTKVHRDFARRYHIDFLARARNEARRTGRKSVSGLEMVERANECQRFYDLAVETFGRPEDPLP